MDKEKTEYEIYRLTEPEADRDSVLLKVSALWICGSELNISKSHGLSGPRLTQMRRPCLGKENHHE